LIDRAAGGDRAELLDAVVADADIPVVEVDGRVAMAGDQADLVAEPEPGHPAWPVIAVIGPRTVRVSLTIPLVTKQN
jgi:hypothetical protein